MKLFIVLSMLCSFRVNAYVQNRSQNDSGVHWTSSVTLIDLYLNTTNSLGLTSGEVNSIVADSIAQWNGKSRITLRKNITANTNQENFNEIYFTSDPTVFAGGSGVVGVTQVLFKNNSGEIIEADILLNDIYADFTSAKKAVSFLGNVITHELGHFLGLGHSQVAGSTMFYALSRGQSEIADDDKAGIYSIYPNGDSTKGSITGKIVGGKSLATVFGAHVQAISLATGKVAGSNLSDVDGSFVIDGLNKNDQYFIYTSPLVKIGLPSRFNNAKFDFCNSSEKYRGSFFQSCGSSGEGFPQAIKLNSAQAQVGNITIRCGLDVPVDYIQNKNSSSYIFDAQAPVLSGVGNAFTGYFSKQEIDQSTLISPAADKFRFDFSNVDWSLYSPVDDLWVEIKMTNQAFYSPYKANISVRRNSGTSYGNDYTEQDDGWLNIDTVLRVKINRADSSDNDFEITILPEPMDFPRFPVNLPYTKTDYFPASGNFEDSVYFYLVSASIVKDNGNTTFTLKSFKNQSLSDNTTCPDAVNTYALTNYSANGTTVKAASKKKDGIFGCGTIDVQAGPGSGPGGFFIGLILSLIICSLTSSIIKQNRSKHYSKIA